MRLEKLQIKISQPKDLLDSDLYSNDTFLKNLKIEERYVSYKQQDASELESKYFDIFSEYIKKHDSRVARVYPFAYGFTKSFRKCFSRLSR